MSVKTKDDFDGFDDEHRDVLRQVLERYGIKADPPPSTTQNVINAAGAGAAAASDAMAANRGTRAQLAHDEEVLSQQRQNDYRNYSVVREGDKREGGKSAFREMQHADYIKNGGSGYKPKAGLPSYGFGPKSASDAEKDAAASYLVEQLTRLQRQDSALPAAVDPGRFAYSKDVMDASAAERGLGIGSAAAGIASQIPAGGWKKAGSVLGKVGKGILKLIF